ncbi:peptide ABC transporter substrate-binding protein [Streptoalloteichus tenebrarius]|nr:ABC transporter substrate-binding protein [Streptoalloteichus tenebrarius]
MTYRKRMAAVGAAVGLLVGTAACSMNTQTGGSSGVLRVDNGADPTHLAPQQNTGSQVAMALCEPLTGLNPSTGAVEMRAATSVDSPDAQHYTIKIREGRKFHNGEDVTAHSFADAWNATAYGPNGWLGNTTFSPVAGYDEMNTTGTPAVKELSGVKVVDDHTLQVTLKTPNADFPMVLSTLGTCPMPKSGLADPKAYDNAPVGNGPYKFVKWDHNQQVVVERWEDYPGQKPDAKQIVFKVYQSPDTAYRDVQAGQLDVLRNLPTNLIKDARQSLGDKRTTEVEQQTLIVQMLVPQYVEELRDPRLRQALSMVIDREGLANALLQGGAAPAYSMLSNVANGYRDKSCAACVRDVAKAKELAAQAGGFRKPVVLWYSVGASTQYLEQVAQAVANSVRQDLGVEVQLKPVRGPELQSAYQSNALTGPVINLWGLAYPSADQFLSMFRQGGDGNEYTRYDNPAANELMRQALSAQDKATAARLWGQAEDALLADMPSVPLFFPKAFVAHSECVKVGNVYGDVQYYRSALTCQGK